VTANVILPVAGVASALLVLATLCIIAARSAASVDDSGHGHTDWDEEQNHSGGNS
jgi:hypothetical protein